MSGAVTTSQVRVLLSTSARFNGAPCACCTVCDPEPACRAVWLRVMVVSGMQRYHNGLHVLRCKGISPAKTPCFAFVAWLRRCLTVGLQARLHGGGPPATVSTAFGLPGVYCTSTLLARCLSPRPQHHQALPVSPVTRRRTTCAVVPLCPNEFVPPLCSPIATSWLALAAGARHAHCPLPLCSHLLRRPTASTALQPLAACSPW